MPDEVGSWTYMASFSDGAPGASGGFECVSGSFHGPLQVDPANPLWFQHADGTPFYMRSFHLWFVCRLDSRGALLGTLDFLRAQGFNTVAGPHLSPDYTPLVWVNNGGVYDFSRFDLVEWQRLDKALGEMAARGMVLVPFNIMGGTNGIPRIDTVANFELFLRYWVARWGGFWNATFQPVGEWQEGYTEAEALQLLDYITALDGGRHLVSLHPVPGQVAMAVQQSAAYSYHTVQEKLDDYDPARFTSLISLFNGVHKPVYAHECLWEGNLYQRQPGMDMNNMRKGAWTIALCGGQINYADEVLPGRNYQTPGVYGPCFSQLGTEMAPGGWLYPYLKIMGDFLESLPFSRLTLQPGLASTGICLAEPGVRYVMYAPAGGTVTLNLAAAAGTLKAHWLDPRAGGFARIFSVQGGAIRSIDAPDANDWVLYVDTVTEPDVIPPGPSIGVAATPGQAQITLAWTNPSDADFSGTTIRVSTAGFPANPADGDPVTDKLGQSAAPDSFSHTGLSPGVTYYYSLFAHDWMMNHAGPVQATAVPLAPGDINADGDVDQADFGFVQVCISGPATALAPGCEPADLVPDGAVDPADLTAFERCFSGPNRPPDPDCAS
jgi:hypothetical protein